MKKDEFKIGDVVYCMIHGKGVIESTDENVVSTDESGGDYPIVVMFDKVGRKSYTRNGEYCGWFNRTLFFEEIPIPESAYIKPRWRARFQEAYYYITDTGHIQYYRDGHSREDDSRFLCKNYFQTGEDAKKSKFYKVFNE